MMRRLPVLAAIAAVLFAATSAAQSQPRAEAGERLVIGLAIAPSGLDPHGFLVSSDNTVNNHIYEALTRVRPDGQVEPALAQSWTLTDGRIWDLALRPGVVFHDGTPFSAADVIATFARVRSLQTSLRGLATRLQPIVSIEQRGPHALRLITAAPAPTLPHDLSRVAILRAASAAVTDGFAFNSGPAAIGTGPYRYAAFSPDAGLDLVRNDGWWDGIAPWRSVALRFIPRDSVRSVALLSGDADLVERVTPIDAQILAARPGMALARAPGLASVYIMLNQGRSDGGPFLTGPDGAALAVNPLRDLRVRQALSLAVNRAALTERLLAGAGVPTGQIAAPGGPDHIAGLSPPIQDLARSRALLAEAGYASGLRIVMLAPTDRYANITQVAEAVAQMWTRVGVTTTLETLPWNNLSRRSGRGEYAAKLFACCASIADPLSTTRELLVTHDPARNNGGSNTGRYSNTLLDGIVEQGLTLHPSQARSLAVEQAARIVADDVPMLLLYHPLNIWAARAPVAYTPRLDGLTLAVGARLAR